MFLLDGCRKDHCCKCAIFTHTHTLSPNSPHTRTPPPPPPSHKHTHTQAHTHTHTHTHINTQTHVHTPHKTHVTSRTLWWTCAWIYMCRAPITSTYIMSSRREAGDVWCHHPVLNLRAVIWFPFSISSLVFQPSPLFFLVNFCFCPFLFFFNLV